MRSSSLYAFGVTIHRPACLALLMMGVLGASGPQLAHAAAPIPAKQRVHVIYGTDLFHPHDDPDDHYDLATLFALSNFEIDAILLDLGDRQRARPGRIPLEQMFRLTGRKAPYAVGLSAPLKSADDQGLDRPAEDQRAIELLLETLRKAPAPVTLITAGSVRDVCAAFNREPELLRNKIDRLYINIGSASDSVEWNVKLDLHAYLGVMRSGLPVYWCPCIPVEPNPYSTYWKFQQGQMLEGLPTPVLNFFVYALQRVRPDELDPIRAIETDLRPWRQLPGLSDRNMWCTASFLDAAGYAVKKTEPGYAPVLNPGEDAVDVFSFVPANVEIDDQGQTRSIQEDPQGRIHIFKTRDHEVYQAAMTDCLRYLLMHLTPAKQPQLSPPSR